MAPAAQSPALLLRAQMRGDDDLWLSLLTPEHGRIQALAKGARGSKRRFGTCLQPFHLFHAQWRQRGALIFLAGATPIQQPLGPDPSLPVLMAGWLFLELAEQVSHPGQPQPALFELCLGALKRLGQGVESPEAVRLSMLLAVIELEGWAPNLSLCARCGKAAPWGAVVLSAPAGGCLCPQCARPQDGPVVSAEALQQWQLAQAGRPLGVPLPEAEAPLLRWTEHHLGQALKVPALQSHALGALS